LWAGVRTTSPPYVGAYNLERFREECEISGLGFALRAVLRAGCWLGLAAVGVVTANAGYLEEWASMKPLVPRGYVCMRATNTMGVDGRLAEGTWQAAPWTLDFVDVEARTNTPPPLRTRVKLLWDSTNLYVGADLEEPHLWATQEATSLAVKSDPCFLVFLDADGDGHGYLELAINALGATGVWRYDKPPKDGGTATDISAAFGLRGAVRLNGTLNAANNRDTGWTLEMALPWQSLALWGGQQAPLYDGDQWRLNCVRVAWPAEQVQQRYRKVPDAPDARWAWSPIGVRDLHRPEKWGYVQFSRRRGTRARFIPDPALPAREALQEVYYFQKDFEAKHRRWASSLAELGVSFRPGKELENAPVVRLTPAGFEATVDGPLQGLKPLRWHIQQDARFWADPELRSQMQRYYQTVPDTFNEP
jgi:hypothetical protein